MKRKKELSHGAKLARNLLLFLILGVLVWGLTGFSAPTVRGRFRLLEGANWAGPSDIQGIVNTRYDRWVVASCQDQLLSGGTAGPTWSTGLGRRRGPRWPRCLRDGWTWARSGWRRQMCRREPPPPSWS